MHADDVASLIIARSDSPVLDALQLQKLLYYTQAWHLAITDEPLFDEKVKAWKNGPVVPQVWHQRKERRSRERVWQDVSNIDVSPFDLSIIDAVITKYGGFSGEELSNLTHNESPWKDARLGLDPGEISYQEISPAAMGAYYRENAMLSGREAADLAAGGLWLPRGELGNAKDIDIDSILGELPAAPDDEDPWGGASFATGKPVA